jgi:hypothetical protein
MSQEQLNQLAATVIKAVAEDPRLAKEAFLLLQKIRELKREGA